MILLNFVSDGTYYNDIDLRLAGRLKAYQVT